MAACSCCACRIKPGVLSLRVKPDWEKALPLLEKAAATFKMHKDYEQAATAFEKASLAQERTGS